MLRKIIETILVFIPLLLIGIMLQWCMYPNKAILDLSIGEWIGTILVSLLVSCCIRGCIRD